MKKYKITKEIAELYAQVMEMRGTIKRDMTVSDCDAGVVSVESVLSYMEKFFPIIKDGDIISEEQKEDIQKTSNTLYIILNSKSDDAPSVLEDCLRYLSPEPEPEPEPEPSFSEIAIKELEAAKVLLGGSEGVVFVVSPKEVRRYCPDAACYIAQQSHHLHAVLKALADSMGLLDQEGERL